MRDLYRELGVKPDSTSSEIREAIQWSDDENTRRDAESVLLVQSRRNAYDQLHRVLVDVADLRRRLKLSCQPQMAGYSFVATSARKRGAPQKSQPDKAPGYSPGGTETWSGSLRPHGNSLAKVVRGIHEAITDFLIRIVGLFTAIGLVVVLFKIFAMVSESGNDGHSTLESGYSQVNNAPTNEHDLPVSLPATGSLRIASRGAQYIAPLEIRTSGKENYFVKLVDASTGRKVLDVFVRGGDTTEIEVPIGKFLIKYASGRNWYGYEKLFGVKTRYAEAAHTFEFSIVAGRISGYTVTLYSVANGNLRTKSIGKSDF